MRRSWTTAAAVLLSSVIATLAMLLLVMLLNAAGRSQSIAERDARALDGAASRAETRLLLEVDRFDRSAEQIAHYLGEYETSQVEVTRFLSDEIFGPDAGVNVSLAGPSEGCSDKRLSFQKGDYSACHRFSFSEQHDAGRSKESSPVKIDIRYKLSSTKNEDAWILSRAAPLDEIFEIKSLGDGDPFDCALVLSANHDVIADSGCSGVPFDARLFSSVFNGETEGRETSDTRSITLGERRYRIFAHSVPVAYRIDGSEHEAALLVGLHDVSRYRWDTVSLSPTWVSYIAFGILFVICCIPVLKIVLLGSNDRLRPTDGLLSVIAVTFASGILTMAALDGLYYSRALAQSDEHLKRISEQLSSNLSADLLAAKQTVDDLEGYRVNRVTHEELAKRALDVYYRNPNEAIRTYFNEFFTTQREQYVDILRDRPELTGIDLALDSIFVTDGKGDQLEKMSIRGRNTRVTNVAHRDYFRLLETDPYILPDEGTPFRFEPVDSFTDGRRESVYASWLNDGTERKRAHLSWRPLSLYDVVMPAAHGFAIIDRSGRVQFHSDKDLNLREDFLKECEGDLWIEAAINAESSSIKNADYKGSSHRMYIQPLEGLPWYLIVFREKQPLRMMNVEANTIGVILYTLHVGAVAAMIMFAAAYNFRGVRERFWPSKALHDKYTMVGRILSGWVLLFVLAGSCISGPMLLLLTTIPILGAVACFWVLALEPKGVGAVVEFAGKVVLGAGALAILAMLSVYGERVEDVSWFSIATIAAILAVGEIRCWWPRESWRRRYATMATVLFVVVTILPAWTIVRFAYQYERELLVRNEQLELSKELKQRRLRVIEAYANVKLPEVFLARRLDVSGPDILLGGQTQVEVTPEPPADVPRAEDSALVVKIHEWLNRVRPFYDHTSVINADLYKRPGPGRAWNWHGRDGDGRLVFMNPEANCLDTNASADRSVLTIRSTVPPPSDQRTLWLICILAAVAVTHVLVRELTHKLLLLHIDDQNTSDIHPDVLGQRTLILGTAYENPAAFGDTTIHRGLSGIEVDAPLFLLDADELIASPSQHRALLATLRRIEKKTKVVVFSRRDPMDGFPWDVDKTTGPHVPAPHLRESWAELWSSYERLVPKFWPPRPGRATLRGECVGFPELNGLAEELENSAALREASDAELFRRFGMRADAFYQKLWDRASLEEKRVLAQTAGPALVNWKNRHVLRRLVRMRLIHRQPAPRLFNRTFTTFVRLRSRRQGVFELKRDERPGIWQRLRVPLVTSLFVIGVVMFATQRQLFVSTTAGISALVTLAPLMLQLLGVVSRQSAGQDQ